MSLLREWWGPRFWKILHTMAECSGSISSLILENDEADLWEILLKAQGFVMTCALCKEHYIKWYRSHKPVNIRGIKGIERKDFLRKWLWQCHNNVNISSQKEIFLEEKITETYKKESLKEPIQQIYEMFRMALERSQLKPEDVNRWRSVVTRLRIMYGI